MRIWYHKRRYYTHLYILLFYCFFMVSILRKDDKRQIVELLEVQKSRVSVFERNSRRINHLESFCRQEESTDSRFRKKKKIRNCKTDTCPVYTVAQHKLSLCIVDKVGSTTLRSHLIKLAGFREFSSSENQKYLDKYPVEFLLESPFVFNYKLMFVRHPFRRLVSAYYSIMILDCGNILETNDNYLCAIAKKIARTYRDSEDLSSTVTFREFASYIIDNSDKPLDPHWSRIWIECRPCTVHYDFIGKIETAKDDLEFLYKSLDVHKTLKNVSYVMNRSGSEQLIAECFIQLSFNELQQLYKVYEKDFLYFNYTIDEFVKYVQP